MCARKKTFRIHCGHLLWTVDIYRQVQANQTWCQGPTLGAGHCLYGKVGSCVLRPRKPRAPGGVGMFPRMAHIYLDGRESMILVAMWGWRELVFNREAVRWGWWMCRDTLCCGVARYWVPFKSSPQFLITTPTERFYNFPLTHLLTPRRKPVLFTLLHHWWRM